jgi:predicted 3-demethylubiquinone-9 3-methyltransferase (glyoxalase superfamily)
MQKITPFLWFNGQAEKAAAFYTAVFKNSKILDIARYAKGSPGKPGSVMTVRFRIEGQDFVALNGGPECKFTHAISFVVNCRTQKEIDYYWRRLSAGGKKIQCGWLRDKFGVSWQIVPTIVPGLLTGNDTERSARVMKAVLSMIKLDIRRLKRAAGA